MKTEYYEHHKLFVYGIYSLYKNSISEESLNIAAEILKEYVWKFEIMYEKEYMTSNVHQILHLTQVINDFGPLWAFSCFPYEDIDGKLKDLVHSSNSA